MLTTSWYNHTMDNFVYGVLGVFRGVEESIRLLYISPSVRGFVIGFIVATLFFAFIITDKPREDVLKDGIKEVNKGVLAVKLLFAIALLLFNLMLLLFFFFYVSSLR